jgi:hypothetical protein
VHSVARTRSLGALPESVRPSPSSTASTTSASRTRPTRAWPMRCALSEEILDLQ